jgi:septal ring factor EnvC (AmiA/AmiB activator)
MCKALSNDKRVLNQELAQNKKSSAEFEEKLRAQAVHMKALEENMGRIKEEKKVQYKSMLDAEVLPYFKKLHEGSGSDSSAIDAMEHTLQKGLENAFMDPAESDTLRFVSAVASADKVRSSDLERLLRTEAEWGAKCESLMLQKTAMEQQTASKLETDGAASKLQNTLMEDLKRELAELKATAAQAAENVLNTDAHFDAKVGQSSATRELAAPAAPVVTESVSATASADAGAGRGMNSLFDFKPNFGWRTSFPDPGRTGGGGTDLI